MNAVVSDLERLEIQRRAFNSEHLAALPEDLHPVLRRVYAARDMSSEQLDHSLAALLPVSELESALRAAERLLRALRNRESIIVIGDFDADGATASALVVSCLRGFGFEHVEFRVPDRFRMGYGLSVSIAEEAASAGPDLIVTVDNGVSSLAGVQRARELGMDVIVTDHHLPGAQLPDANVIVNPNLPRESFRGKSLAGVGVAFYVMAALARRLGEQGIIDSKIAQQILQSTLDLVALGTVADLVPLDYNNRILVEAGLRRMRSGHGRPGIQALFTAAGRNIRAAKSSDLGYAIGPRLNAAGRLTDMSLGISCLLAESSTKAQSLASQLEHLNNERREMQTAMEADAREYLRKAADQLDGQNANAYCLFDTQWHEGIVGLVATRLKDQCRRPVIAFAPADETGLLKGSARSVQGIHVRDVLDQLAARHPSMIKKFGGHAMAAGLTLRADDLDDFSRVFEEAVGACSGGFAQANVLWTDGDLSQDELQVDFAAQLASAQPWGQACPEPMFDGCFEVVTARLLKERHLKMALRPPGSRMNIDAIAFNQAELPSQASDADIRFAYRLDVNEYRNRRQAQLIVEHMQLEE